MAVPQLRSLNLEPKLHPHTPHTQTHTSQTHLHTYLKQLSPCWVLAGQGRARHGLWNGPAARVIQRGGRHECVRCHFLAITVPDSGQVLCSHHQDLQQNNMPVSRLSLWLPLFCLLSLTMGSCSACTTTRGCSWENMAVRNSGRYHAFTLFTIFEDGHFGVCTYAH